METLKDFLRNKVTSVGLTFLIALLLANVLMNVRRPSSIERIDVCSSRLTGFENIFGAGKANGCPVYRDATVEKTGFPFVEKYSYSTESSGIILLTCDSGLVTRQLKNENKCPSWGKLEAFGYKHVTPAFLRWKNFWTCFIVLLLLRWLLVIFWANRDDAGSFYKNQNSRTQKKNHP